MPTDTATRDDQAPTRDKHPIPALLALGMAVFITVLTETLPAGLLPQLSRDLTVSRSLAGQTVTVYAIGTALTAIPLAAATAAWRRKRLLLTAMFGFAAANSITVVSTSFPLTMGARFLAGVAAGVAWALLAGYARRMAPVHLQGKAIAIVMAGIPIALSLGVPAGTYLGSALGWRVTFGVMSALAIALIAWIIAVVPDFPGQRQTGSTLIVTTFRLAGVIPILFVTLFLVLAHNVLYTYIATFLRHVNLAGSVGTVLLVFGISSMASIVIVGSYIDRRLRGLVIGSVVLIGIGAALLAALSGIPALTYLAVALWGLGWGGAPTLLQTAVADAGGEFADTAQAMLVTLWNAAMAAGGVVGGILLSALGSGAFPYSVVLLTIPVLFIVLFARHHAFPKRH